MAEESNTKCDPGPCSCLQSSVIVEILRNTGHMEHVQYYIENSYNLEVTSGMITTWEILETFYYTPTFSTNQNY